jgi:hypothetical protein
LARAQEEGFEEDFGEDQGTEEAESGTEKGCETEGDDTEVENEADGELEEFGRGVAALAVLSRVMLDFQGGDAVGGAEDETVDMGEGAAVGGDSFG